MRHCLAESQCWKGKGSRFGGAGTENEGDSIGLLPGSTKLILSRRKLLTPSFCLGWERTGACVQHFGFSRAVWETISLLTNLEPWWDTAWEAIGNKRKLGGMQQLQKICNTMDRHKREQEITSFWKESANSSNWEFTHMGPEKTHAQKRFKSLRLSLVNQIGEASPQRLWVVVCFINMYTPTQIYKTHDETRKHTLFKWTK